MKPMWTLVVFPPWIQIRLTPVLDPAVEPDTGSGSVPSSSVASLVIGREICSCSAADLFGKLGICGFDVKPRDALVKQANGDKAAPVGPSGCSAVTRDQSERPSEVGVHVRRSEHSPGTLHQTNVWPGFTSCDFTAPLFQVALVRQSPETFWKSLRRPGSVLWCPGAPGGLGSIIVIESKSLQNHIKPMRFPNLRE